MLHLRPYDTQKIPTSVDARWRSDLCLVFLHSTKRDVCTYVDGVRKYVYEYEKVFPPYFPSSSSLQVELWGVDEQLSISVNYMYIFLKTFTFLLAAISRAYKNSYSIVFHDNCMHIICTTSGKLWKRLPVCEIGTEKKIQLWELGESGGF